MAYTTDKLFTCDLCKLSFTSEQHIRIHLDGILHQKMAKGKFQQENSTGNIFKTITRESTSSPPPVKIPGLGDYDEVEAPSPEIPRAVIGRKSCLKRPSSSSVSYSTSGAFTVPNVSVNSVVMSDAEAQSANFLRTIKSFLSRSRSSSQTNNNSYSELQISCMQNSPKDDGFQRPNQTNETERVSSVGETKRRLNSRSVSLAVNLLDIQRDLQKPLPVRHEKTDSQPKHLPKAEAKSRSSIQTLLSAQFDLLKSYMVEQLGSSANPRDTAPDASKQTSSDDWKHMKRRRLMEDDSETSKNVMDLHYSECALPKSLDSECKIPFLCDNDESVCDSAPAAVRSGVANRNTKCLISQTLRENQVPLALSQASRYASEDFSCNTLSYCHQNVDHVGPPPMQMPLRPRAPSVQGQDLTSCLSSDDHLPHDFLDIHEYSCKNLTSGVSRGALLPAADEPWPIARQSAVANSTADDRSLDDYVARMKLNLSRGLAYSLSTFRLNEKEKFTPATSSQQKEKFTPATSSQQKEKFTPATSSQQKEKFAPATSSQQKEKFAPATSSQQKEKFTPATSSQQKEKFAPATSSKQKEKFAPVISSQQNIPAKKVLLMTPPEPTAPLETRKILLPTPSAGLDFHPPAANGAINHPRPVAPASASSNCSQRTEHSIRVTSSLLPNPTVEGRTRQPPETGLLCPQPPKHRLASPSSFLRCSDASTTPYAKPAAASAVGKKSATVSDSPVKDAMTSLATLSSSSSSLKTASAIEVPVVVSLTSASTTLEACSSGVNEDLPEVEEANKSCKEQVKSQIKLQKQVKAAQKLTNYSKEAHADSAVVSDGKLEFHGKRLDRSPEQVAEDTVDKVQPSGGAVRVEKMNDFHKQTEDIHLLNLVGPLAQQCHGSVEVGENTNAQDLTSEEQLDPQLKLQREIESIMQERIKDLKETLPESMICSINEGKIPLEFLDRISDLIPREVIDKAVNEVERSADVALAKIDKTKDSQMQETDGRQFSNLEMIETSAENAVDQQVPEQVPEQMPEQVSGICLSKPDRENIKAQIEVEALKTLNLEVVKRFIEGILGDFVNEDVPPVNIGMVEKLDVTDRAIALKMLQETGIRDVLVIVEILNFFKTFDNKLLSALINTYDANAGGKESVLYRVVEVVLKKRQEMKSQESEAKNHVTVERSDKNALPILDNRQENASNVLESPIVTETVSNTLSQQVLDSKMSCVEKMPNGTRMLCVNSEPANLEHCAKECPKTKASSTLESDAAIATMAVSKTDQVAISSSVRHSDIASSCGRTELQLTALRPCDRSDDTKALEPMEPTGSQLSRSAELSNTQPKTNDDSEMLEAESTQKPMQLGATEEIADAVVSDSDLKLTFEKHLCGSSEAASPSKEHSSNNSGDGKQSVQPLSSASAVDSVNPNEEVLCANDDSACVAVSLANSSLPQQKLSEVERLKPKKILLPTPSLYLSMSRPDVRPLMALHDPPRLKAPVYFLSQLSRSAELSNTWPKTTDSEMLEAETESTRKPMQSGATEEIADAVVSDSDLKLTFEKHLCGSFEAANASNSKEHSSSNNSSDGKQSVQPLSNASAVDSVNPNEEVLCAKDGSACVAVSLANSSLPQQKLSEVERLKPKKILLPTPNQFLSMSRPDVRPLMALHDPPRLRAPVCLLGPDEASVKPPIPPLLLFSQRLPSRPLSSLPSPQSFSSTKVLLPSPISMSVPRFQFSNEEPRPIVQLEVSRPLLAQRTPLLQVSISSSVRHSDIASSCERTELQLATLGPCDSSDDTKVLEPTGNPLSRSAELSNMRPKTTDDSEMLKAESTRKPMQSGAAEEIADAVVSDSDLKLTFEKHLCGSLEAANASNSKEHSSSNSSSDGKQSVQPLSSASAVDSVNPNEEVLCAKADSACVAVSLANSSLPQQKLSEVECLKPKKILLPTPNQFLSMSRPDVRPLMALHDPPRLKAPVWLLGSDEASVKPPIPPLLLFSQRLPSRPLSSLPSPRSFSSTKVLLPSPISMSVPRFQFSNEELRPIVQLEVSRPLLAQRTPLLQVSISSSVRHSDIAISCERTELQLTTLGPCDSSDDTKVLEPTGSQLSRSAELSNMRPKTTDDSEMLKAESTQKQIQSGATEEIADAVVSDSDLKLTFEKHLCGSLEAANASNSKEHSSSNNSSDGKQSVQPLSSASAVDSVNLNEEVLCAKADSACVAVSLANSSLPQQKLSEVERLKPKKILLPTPNQFLSMSRPDVRPLMALHDPPRLRAPVCLLGPDEASVKPPIPPLLLFSQRLPSRPLSSLPSPQSFSSTKVLLPSPISISVPRFQFSNEEPRPIVQLEVSRPLLAQRTPLLRLPLHEATLRSSQQVLVHGHALLPSPNMILTETVGSQPFIGSFYPLKRQAPQLMMEGLGPPPFKRLR